MPYYMIDCRRRCFVEVIPETEADQALMAKLPTTDTNIADMYTPTDEELSRLNELIRKGIPQPRPK